MAFSLLLSTVQARLSQSLVAALALLSLALGTSNCWSADPTVEGVSTREAKLQAIQAVPFKKISQSTSQALRDVLDNPSFYRRMPTQTIQCDPELFSFLVRKPEVMVNTWDLMGITKVTAKRTGPYSFLANDGVGTKCKCDLVYGDDNTHIYYGAGDYDGSMYARTIKGRAVCILRSENQPYPQGHSGHMVRGTMDVFLKLDNLGADLLTRTFGPLVAKTADHNFAETAQFVSQLSQICANNPPAALGLASQLNNIEEPVRQEFASIATRIAEGSQTVKRTTADDRIAGNVSANQAQVAQTLQELKVATGPKGTEGIETIRQKLTASPKLNEHSATVPAMQLHLSDSNSVRRPSLGAIDRTQHLPADPLSTSNLAPSSVQPKKTGVTMRR